MRQKVLWGTASVALLAAILALAALPVNIADARMQASPTPSGLDGFAVPTSTPASAPAEVPTEASVTTGPLPALSDADLEALNLAASDVPAEFAGSRTVESYDITETIAEIVPIAQDLADTLQALSDDYEWTTSIRVSYETCDPTVPVNRIYSEVGQLGSVEQARALIDDPRAQQFVNEAIGPVTIMPSFASVHGWLIAEPLDETTCFDAETEYSLTFDYRGLLISASVTVNSATDMSLVESLLGQLAPVLVAKVDALSATPFEPTPSMAAAAVLPAPIRTPSSTRSGSDLDATAVLQQINAVMPTIEELQLPQPPFRLDEAQSGVFSLDIEVAGMQASGMTEIAAAVQQAHIANNFIGGITRVWDTGTECPNTSGLTVESDVSVFPSAADALSDLADEGVRQAWLNTSIIHTYEIDAAAGVSTMRGTAQNSCGWVELYAREINIGRFNITAVLVAYSTASEGDMLSVLDALNQLVKQKIADAGIE